MIKMMLAVRRKPGMSLADYRDYIVVQHGKLAFDQPNGVMRYVQNHVFDGAYGTATDPVHGPLFGRDSVTELWFAGLAEFGRSMAHPYTHEVIIPDGRNFADVPTNLVLVTREEEIEVPSFSLNSSAGVKVLHYLQKPEHLSLEDFSIRWSTALKTIIASNRSLAQTLRRCVLSHALPPPPAKAAGGPPGGFGHGALPSFHGVASLWFDDDESLYALRGYLHDLAALGAGEAGFFNPSASFYLCTRELCIFDLSQA